MLDTLINIGLIVLGFGILIFFHELGHFLAAKWAGIRTEAFAIGMGPVVAAYRRGVGFRMSSTAPSVEKRVNEYYKDREEDSIKFRERAESDPDFARKQVYDAMDALGIGATEYSLRWLPIGGFVKMLGQEDANPQATSTLRGSYQNTPVGKRMIVVSAGVIANLILAVVLFVWAFMVGFPDVAPVVGAVSPDSPAARAVALNAASAGITEPGLQPGDRFIRIDEGDIKTFSDVRLEAAMANPSHPLEIEVERDTDAGPKRLGFQITPEKDATGLLSLGIAAASSTRLYQDDADGYIARILEDSGLAAQGIENGMTILRAAGRPISTMQQFERIVDDSRGEPVHTEWAMITEDGEQIGATIAASVPVHPELQMVTSEFTGERIVEYALIGFSPLTRISFVDEASPNLGVIEAGDLILQIANIEAPRRNEFRTVISESPGETLEAVVLRGGEKRRLELQVGRNGRIGVGVESANDVLMTARPITEYTQRDDPEGPITREPGPLAGKDIWPLSTIRAVDGRAVSDWRSFREALLDQTRAAFENETAATVALTLELDSPEPTDPQVTEIEISKEEVAELHALRWTSDLDPGLFEPVTTMLTANGNPLVAIGMGFERTYKFVINTYLTIDRLFRGTVGVEQLRGPVGIVHLGTLIADRGFMYLIFFLAMISVNLAVINFLPLPIVDGGLFLFLIYEKIKGRPPSVAFQNWATIAGLAMIVTLFLVVTYNDVTRLIFGGM